MCKKLKKKILHVLTSNPGKKKWAITEANLVKYMRHTTITIPMDEFATPGDTTDQVFQRIAWHLVEERCLFPGDAILVKTISSPRKADTILLVTTSMSDTLNYNELLVPNTNLKLIKLH